MLILSLRHEKFWHLAEVSRKLFPICWNIFRKFGQKSGKFRTGGELWGYVHVLASKLGCYYAKIIMARSIDFSENPSKNRIFAKLAMFTVKYLKLQRLKNILLTPKGSPISI